MFETQHTNDTSPRLRVVSGSETIWLSNELVVDMPHEQILAVATYCETSNMLLEGLGNLLKLGRKHARLGTAMADFGRFMGGE